MFLIIPSKNLEMCREALMEAVAETSEEYMDRYFAGDEFTYDEISIRHCVPARVWTEQSFPISDGRPASMARGTTMHPAGDIEKYFASPGKAGVLWERIWKSRRSLYDARLSGLQIR